MDFNTDPEIQTTFWREWHEHYDQMLRTDPRTWFVETFQELIKEERDQCLLKLNHYLSLATSTPSACASHFQDTNLD